MLPHIVIDQLAFDEWRSHYHISDTEFRLRHPRSPIQLFRWEHEPMTTWPARKSDSYCASIAPRWLHGGEILTYSTRMLLGVSLHCSGDAGGFNIYRTNVFLEEIIQYCFFHFVLLLLVGIWYGNLTDTAMLKHCGKILYKRRRHRSHVLEIWTLMERFLYHNTDLKD